MSKTLFYVIGAVVCLGIGALIAGLAVHYAGGNDAENYPQMADCILLQHQGRNLGITGRLTLNQNPSENLIINGTISGLPEGLHGFHIHQYGIYEFDCVSAAGHFNPDNNIHGSPTDALRHVGDLGNINVTYSGATFDYDVEITDHKASLYGKDSIMGRSIVVHQDADDFVTQPTGNAGGRLACCTIMKANPQL